MAMCIVPGNSVKLINEHFHMATEFIKQPNSKLGALAPPTPTPTNPNAKHPKSTIVNNFTSTGNLILQLYSAKDENVEKHMSN